MRSFRTPGVVTKKAALERLGRAICRRVPRDFHYATLGTELDNNLAFDILMRICKAEWGMVSQKVLLALLNDALSLVHELPSSEMTVRLLEMAIYNETKNPTPPSKNDLTQN